MQPVSRAFEGFIVLLIPYISALHDNEVSSNYLDISCTSKPEIYPCEISGSGPFWIWALAEDFPDDVVLRTGYKIDDDSERTSST